MSRKWILCISLALATLLVVLAPAAALAAPAFQATMVPEPVVAIHVSEHTQALDTGGTWYTSWHYLVIVESLKEALSSDGTPFVEVSDADIAAGHLLYPDGSPRYPIVISLASEAIADAEIAPLRDYVAAGGFLFVGSSAFTRHADGTPRGDFALADEMGLHVANPDHSQNWYQNVQFTKTMDHRLVWHIPWGTLTWRMPLYSEEIPWGVTGSHTVHGNHDVWRVAASDAEVIANGGSGPLLVTRGYGHGRFIYHGAFNPLIGHGGNDPGMYAYLIYRNAIEWAFEFANLPIVKRSPWRYGYDAAFVVRHDFENTPSRIQSIEASAQAEQAAGAKGDYYFCTGTLREHMGDPTATVASLRRAISLYGATIGSHNGGLVNPVNPALSPSAYDYWHWGPDEALDTHPPGYADGYAYAYTSVLTSFLDIEGWLDGVDNGRPGCGAADNCPRVWVSPYFNSAREGSYDILGQLGAVAMGEQKISPFPHWTLSYQTPGQRHSHVTLPVSDWYIGTNVAQSLESGHDASTVRAAVDFYYHLGALVNLYGHGSSAGGVQQEYVTYSASKPGMWATNAVGVYDWWLLRSNVTVMPTYSQAGNTAIAGATVSGATAPDTAVEMVIPHWDSGAVSGLQVFLDGAPADPADFRTTNYGVKVRVGTTASSVEVRYTPLEGWVQTDWAGGAGQAVWADETRYDSAVGVDDSVEGQVQLGIASGGDPLFSDDFTRPPDPDPVPFTWIIPPVSAPWPNRGVFNTNGGVLNCGTSEPGPYGYAYTNTVVIADHSVEADIRFPQILNFSGGGGIFGRLNPATGQRYAVWVYPETAAGGTATIRALKFYAQWGWWNSPGFASVSIPGGVGSGWHHLRLSFTGNRIRVFYDGSLIIDDTDNGNEPNCGQYNSCAPYTNGYAGVDLWTASNSRSLYGPTFNNFVVRDSSDAIVWSDTFGLDPVDPLLPWAVRLGTWTVMSGELHAGSRSGYTYVYTYTAPLWADYSVEGRIQFPAGAFGGGLGGRVDPATGAHYGAWVYPDGSSGGSNVLKLVKFRDWANWSGTPMQQVNLPSVGTGWHTLKMAFDANRIRVYYDGAPVIDVTDNNYDGRPAYLGGGVSVDTWVASGYSGPYAIAADDIVVRTPAQYGASGTLLSSAFDGGVGVEWQTVSWNAAAGGDTGVRVRTRTAQRANQLAAAPWSDWITDSGSPVTSADHRWIQYQLELTSSDPTATPIFYEIGTTYVPGIRLPGSNLTYTGPVTGDSESQITLSATLLDDDDAPIVGRTVDFTLSGVNGLLAASATTDGNGAASSPLNLMTAPGQYSLTVAFAGDTAFAPVSIVLPFEVTSPWSEWVQDSQADFQGDTLASLDPTTRPGSVLLEETLVGEGEETGSFSVGGTPGWSYRRRLFVDNNVASELPTGYSLRLILDTATLASEGKLRPDGNDLRVVWTGGPAPVELDRVAETPFNSAATDVWFKSQALIPGNGRDGDYYIYYGNPATGTPPADRADVYALWDDFDGTSLDPRWSPQGTVAVSGGQAHLASNANIIGTTPYTFASLETRVRFGGENNYAWCGWEDGRTDAPNFIVFEEFPVPNGLEALIRNDGAPFSRLPIADPPGGLAAWHTYVTDWWPGQARWSMDGTEVMSATTNVPDSGMYVNFYARALPMDVDWVKARLRAAQEPSVTLATPQPGYGSQGQLLSIAYDTGQFSSWKYLTWDATTPPDTGVSLQVRTAATQDDLSVAPWMNYPQTGLLISNDAGRWVQYEATLTTTNLFTTPALHKVTVYYTSLPVTLTIAPDEQTVAAGQVATYTATVDDGSQTWDVTGETDFNIQPGAGGTWTDNAYTSHFAGDWTATGAYAGLAGTATLHVRPAAALSVTKTSSADPARIGDPLTYTVTVLNAGPATALGVVVTDTLPVGVTFGAAASSQGTCNGTGPVICTLGELFTGATATVTIAVTPGAAGPLTNTAQASGTDPAGNPVGDADTVTVRVIGPAIGVRKEASTEMAKVGDTITYTYTVDNAGDATLTGVSASDDRLGLIPLGRTTLAPGETTTGTATYTVTESDLPGPLTNTVTVTGTPPAGDAVTNTAITTVSLKPKGTIIYLPIVLHKYAPPAPDLVVEQITVAGSRVQVVIKNQGDAPVLGDNEFWVDLYVDPHPVPTAVNQTWDALCSRGIVWGVTAPALPLAVGQTITLTIGDDYYRDDYSHFPTPLPAGLPIYVQVDSANLNSTYGGVLENHEQRGEPYNNVSGPVFSALSTMSDAPAEAGRPAQEDPRRTEGHRLPLRP